MRTRPIEGAVRKESYACEFYPNLYKLHAVRISNAPDPIIDLAQDASFDTCANQQAIDLASIILMALI